MKAIFRFLKKHIYAIAAGLIITGYTVYLLMDAFTIVRVLDSSANEYAVTSESIGAVSSGTVQISERSYSDNNIKIEITDHRQYETTIYVADITLTGAEYIKTSFAEGCYGRNIRATTSEIAGSMNAILAVNGDYYGARELGYVLRNGVIFRDTPERNREDLVIFRDGSFRIIRETETSLSELQESGARQVLSFGPALVENSVIAVSGKDQKGIAAVCNPRTAIGIIDEGHYVFVVADGRSEESRGLVLTELAEFMLGLGAATAYNLDGGGSSTMVFNGTVINKPTEYGSKVEERGVSDIVYIGY